MVRAHARAHPNRIAVVAGGERLDYAALDHAVDRLASSLRTAGVRRRSVVGVHLGRGADTVTALLAVLRVGAAYTVVEPTDPVEEGVRRLVVARPDLVLTAPRYQDAVLAGGLTVGLVGGSGDGTEVPDVETTADDVAYVLYTSGSTGVPKGVVVTHGNVRHYTESLLARLGITEPLSYAHVTTLAADLGNTGLFLALWTGGTLHLVGDERRDPDGLLRYLAAERIDVVKTTPSHWGAVSRAVDGDTAPRLRFLLLGGELLSRSLARAVLTSGVTSVLVNHYGPTETTVGVAAHVLTDVSEVDALHTASVPIGTALGDTKLLVRADDGTTRHRDIEGELLIAGPSVTAGYRGDDGASSAVFTVEPGVGRVYRTGDRVRADADGVLEYLGRGDRQVKIGGYRVEPGHVEAVLRTLPGVTDAVVVHRGGDRPALLAAVLGSGVDDPRGALRELLPRHMIPERVEVVDAFPRTGNGKVDHAAVRELVERRAARRVHAEHEVDDPVLAEVLAVWRRHLGHGDFTADDDFGAVGGSSIDAIGVIADLQASGHPVSAAAFLASPTAAALADRLRSGVEEPGLAIPAAPADDRALSPAQEWFFRQHFPQPDHWNQALLLDLDPDVRSGTLAAAIDDVVASHPLLHTAFRGIGTDRRREVVEPTASFTTSAMPDEDPDRHVREVAAARQADIRIADGVVFRAHLFRGTGRAHLLLVAHHLCVDAVSWRIIVNDISRRYSERLHGREPRGVRANVDFATWATRLRSRAEELRSDLAHWGDLPDPPPPATGDNREGAAKAVWFALSRGETEALGRVRIGRSPAALLLGAFAQALAEFDGSDRVVVDVESHGRESDDDTVDVSRAVGWFTSSFPVLVEVAGDLAVTAKCATVVLDEVPHLGIAYGLHRLPRRADACLNYLGALALPYGDDLRPTFSRLPLGPVRGPRNDRGHALKLTARIHGGQLVADLSYTPGRCPPERALALAKAIRDNLGRFTGLPATEGRFVVEDGSTTGLLAHLPRGLRLDDDTPSTRHYQAVLLTGATGFIGAHLLHLLLTRTTGHVHCLVRPDRDRSAVDRLRAAYAWAVPGGDLDRHADRLTVHVGDLVEPRFALAERDYRALCRDVEAVYHLAADTRLFGDRDSFARANVEPVRALIGLATTDRPKHLHHVSTLAVCGSGSDGEPAAFSEDSLDIGQRFLNEYERSKYEAERLIAEFAAGGGTGFVYRSGNVTGHSATGRFQHNGGDNRLVQVLRAAVLLGRVPRVGDRTLALSPVDIVAEGILAISRDAPVRGGTFHVDTDRSISYAEVFAALRDLGHDLVEDDAPDFATLFGRHRDADERVGLAHFWADRPERNVRYDHTRTLRLLAELGVRFPALDRTWLRIHLAGLLDRDEIASSTDRGGA